MQQFLDQADCLDSGPGTTKLVAAVPPTAAIDTHIEVSDIVAAETSPPLLTFTLIVAPKRFSELHRAAAPPIGAAAIRPSTLEQPSKPRR